MGAEHQVPLNEPELGNAIHGLVRWVAWIGRGRGVRTASSWSTCSVRSPGYPFTLRLRIAYLVADDGLAVTTDGDQRRVLRVPVRRPAPIPGSPSATPTVDPAALRIPAAVAIWSDERSLPVADRRRSTAPSWTSGPRRPIGATKIDNGFTDARAGRERASRTSRSTGPSGDGVAVWFDRSYPYVMLSTGDVLPDVARRSIAIEPMTCPPNAFQTGEALVRLEPGDDFTGNWGISTSVRGEHTCRWRTRPPS